MKRVYLFLWKFIYPYGRSHSSKLKYKAEKHPNVSLAMVELGVLIALQKWEHSSAKRDTEGQKEKEKPALVPWGKSGLELVLTLAELMRFCDL